MEHAVNRAGLGTAQWNAIAAVFGVTLKPEDWSGGALAAYPHSIGCLCLCTCTLRGWGGCSNFALGGNSSLIQMSFIWVELGFRCGFIAALLVRKGPKVTASLFVAEHWSLLLWK